MFGSTPMAAKGIKELSHDLDVIARGAAWEKAGTLGKIEPTRFGEGEVVELFDGEIEIFNQWLPFNVDQLIDTAETIEGIKFVTLENVLRWKKQMNRPKDIEHIALIEKYLKERQ